MNGPATPPPNPRADAVGSRITTVGVAAAAFLTPLAFDARLYDDFTLIKQAAMLVCSAVVLIGLALSRAFPRSPWLRAAVGAWAAWLVVTWVTGIDPRGGLLGVYQYREGLITQLCYVILFLGAVSVERSNGPRAIFLAGAAGLCGVFAYTAVQAVGLDPISWWIDTSDRAIGTIGNANELAAFAVVALGFAGAPVAARWRTPLIVFAGAAATFIVIAAQSRSGLIALVITYALFPVASMVARRRLTETISRGKWLVAGAAIGALLAFAAGSVASTASRVEGGVQQSSMGDSTRWGLWRGTIATIKASPIVGYGADGLVHAFPIHRPADLGGAFASYDLPVQSSHNWFLDVAAETGIPGLLILVTFLASGALSSVRPARAAEAAGWQPFAWAALAGYVALTMLNPLSLAAHTTFWVLLGLLAGTSEPATMPAPAGPRVRMAFVVAAAPGAAAMLAVAVLLPIADGAANDGWAAYAGRDFQSSAEHYALAARLMPIERRYARSEAGALLAEGSAGDRSALEAAKARYRQINAEFGLSGGEALGLATAQIGLGEPAADIKATIAQALRLNPYGVSMRTYTDKLILAAQARGLLKYSETDRWVYVEVAPH